MKRFLLVPVIWLGVTLSAQQPAAVPEIPFDSVPNFLKLPADMNFGEGSAGLRVRLGRFLACSWRAFSYGFFATRSERFRMRLAFPARPRPRP